MNLRLPVHIAVEVETSDDLCKGAAVDLSFEGARVRLIDSEKSFDSGQTARLRLDPERDDVTIPVAVVRRNGTELGLMFGQYGPAADLYLSDRLSEALEQYHNGA